MKKHLPYAMSLVAVFALGHVSAGWQAPVAHAQSKAEKAAYLIAVSSGVQAPPDNMAKYREVALPLAKHAGLQILAGGMTGQPSFQLLEGKFPYQGRVGLERFRSMKELLDFWHSDAYQNVRKLRTEAHFIIAVEAVE
jgi:uncharacterized protein (DUF1330 family)